MRIKIDPGGHAEIFGFTIINATAFPAIFERGSWRYPEAEERAASHRGKGDNPYGYEAMGSARDEPRDVVSKEEGEPR